MSAKPRGIVPAAPRACDCQTDRDGAMSVPVVQSRLPLLLFLGHRFFCRWLLGCCFLGRCLGRSLLDRRTLFGRGRCAFGLYLASRRPLRSGFNCCRIRRWLRRRLNYGSRLRSRLNGGYRSLWLGLLLIGCLRLRLLRWLPALLVRAVAAASTATTATPTTARTL